jgi:hypothetical protein
MLLPVPMKIIKIFALMMIFASSAFSFDFNKFKSDAVAAALANEMNVHIPLTLISELIEFQNERELHHVIFSHPNSGITRILVSGPKGFWQSTRKYPVLFVISGFQTGTQSLALIGNPKDIVLVGYQYPATAEEMLAAPGRLTESIFQTIGQSVGIWQWFASQKWVADNKIYNLGVSLGGLFLPVSLRVAESQGFTSAKTVFAFSGAELTSVFENELGNRIPESLKAIFHQAVEVSTELLAPKIHLPYLKGKFMVVRGLQDTVFPKPSGEALEKLLPEPKTIVHLNAKHINVDTPDIIEPMLKAVQGFIEQP